MLLTQTETTVSYDHIMWQPSWSCQRNCFECYLKHWASANPLAVANSEILEAIFHDQTVECDQFTISLDRTSIIESSLKDKLRKIWNGYHETFSEMRTLPRICVTAHNLDDINLWCKELDMTIDDFIYPLDMVTLSRIDRSEECLKFIDLCQNSLPNGFNFNCNLDGMQPSDLLNIRGIGISPHTYFLLEKNPLGKRPFLESIKRFKEHSWLVPVESIDYCTQTRNKLTCNAGSSMAMVWPDGSVTGCPYDSEGLLKVHESTITESLKLLRYQSNSGKHPYSCCKIAEAMKEERNGSK